MRIRHPHQRAKCIPITTWKIVYLTGESFNDLPELFINDTTHWVFACLEATTFPVNVTPQLTRKIVHAM